MYIKSEERVNRFPCTKNGKTFLKKFKKVVHTLQCDNCGNTFEKDRHQLHHRRANNNFKHFCANCHDPALYQVEGIKKRKENLQHLIGDRQVDSMGYVSVYVGGTHSHSIGYSGRVREHVMVMENHLGRHLEKGEVVHHLDGNKTNNDISNLDLCTVAEHNQCHGASEQIVFALYQRGMVGYDRSTKRYYLKE